MFKWEPWWQKSQNWKTLGYLALMEQWEGKKEDWSSFENCQYSNYQTQDEEDLNRVNAFSQVKKALLDRYLKVSKD